MDCDPQAITTLLENLGVTHVVWLPDSSLGKWETALATSRRLRLIRICREGEAWALAAGLYLGGAQPMIVMQNTGLFESGDSMRNALFDLQLPLYAIIGYRGYLLAEFDRVESPQATPPQPRSHDSACTYTQPVVDAWALDHLLIDTPERLPEIAEHYRACQIAHRPGITLLGPRERDRMADDIATARRCMPLLPALKVLADLRRDQIVVTTMGLAREWPKLSRHALDFHYLPSAMGQAPALGLGLALAQPAREVIVLNGDGCMLMNLGCLITIAASRASNFTLVVFENGIYEVTGGQATAAAAMCPAVNFAELARAAGITSVFAFDDLAAWQSQSPGALGAAGSRFICLRVAPVDADYRLPTMPLLRDRITAFRQLIQHPHEADGA